MHLTIYFDHRFSCDAAGTISSPTHYSYELFRQRYLPYFSSIRLVARSNLDCGELRNMGERIDFVSVGDWHGPIDFMRRRRRIYAALTQNMETDVAILIVPGLLGYLGCRILRRAGIKYAVEVVTDPWASMGPGALRHPLSHLMRLYMTYGLRRTCAHAYCAAYVTRNFLQQQYPALRAKHTTHYSSILLRKSDFGSGPREYLKGKKYGRLVSVGSMAQLYKGQDILLRSFAVVAEKVGFAELVFVGDGKYRPMLELMAEDLGIKERVSFVGYLAPGAAVQAQLDSADIYVLPTRGEGLPRSIIEAMARGLPCIGTRVSGVPELLDEDCLVSPNSPEELAKAIVSLMTDPERMQRCSRNNYYRAEDYLSEKLQARRAAMYQALSSTT